MGLDKRWTGEGKILARRRWDRDGKPAGRRRYAASSAEEH